MSKASAWADLLSQRPKLMLPEENSKDGAMELVAEVSERGRLTLKGSVAEPARAIAFARWILATFSDEPGAQP
jgi:hypothetical protein